MATIICYTKKFIFYHIPKTGGTSLERHIVASMKGVEKLANHAHKSFDQIEKYYFDHENYNYEEFFKFTIVRNPWDRMVSCFENLIQTAYNKDFAEFMRSLPEERRGILRGADHYIADTECEVLRFESLLFDVEKVMTRFGISMENFPHLNHTSKNRKHYREYYPEQWMIDQVAKRYEWEIEKFNYRF